MALCLCRLTRVRSGYISTWLRLQPKEIGVPAVYEVDPDAGDAALRSVIEAMMRADPGRETRDASHYRLWLSDPVTGKSIGQPFAVRDLEVIQQAIIKASARRSLDSYSAQELRDALTAKYDAGDYDWQDAV